MSSFGHYIRLATDDELAYWARMRNDDYYKIGDRWIRNFGCQTKGCTEPSTHILGYRYVTGRAGRVSSAEKHHCAEHAERFADKHGLEMPVEPTERPTLRAAIKGWSAPDIDPINDIREMAERARERGI